MANIQKEIWARDIQDLFYRTNSFAKYATDASEYVHNGKTVNLPNASAAGITATRNLSSFPAFISQRADVLVSYDLDSFYSSPMLLTAVEDYEASYNKRNSLLQEICRSVNQLSGDYLLYNWRPQTGVTNGVNIILRTSGATSPATFPGCTGNRNKLTLSDLSAARLAMNRLNVPAEERYIMVSSAMYDQLCGDLNISTYRQAASPYDATTGIVNEIYGFKILERSSLGFYASSGSNTSITFRTPASTALYATDNEVALCWQKDCVEAALGSVKMFGDGHERAEYYGEVYSALLTCGGRHRRGNDFAGVIAIVQQ